MTNWRPDFNPDSLYFVTTTTIDRRCNALVLFFSAAFGPRVTLQNILLLSDKVRCTWVSLGSYDRSHLFRRDVVNRLVVDTLDCFRLRGRFKLYTFVVMPNHIHLILQCQPDDPPSDVMRDLKKHIADRLVRHYRAEDNQEALAFLVSKVTRPEKQVRKVWEDGYNAKEVFSPEFLRQKITYCHDNPCQPHWSLVECPEAYMWSSARYYLLNEPAIIPVDDARELLA